MTGSRAAPLARAAFAALVVLSFLAFFWAQELKRRDPLVRGWTHADVRFPRPGVRFAHFRVTATVSGPLTVSILDRSGRAIARFAVAVRRYRHHEISWDGRTSAGTPAPPGAYRVAVRVSGSSATVALTGLTLTLVGPS